ncbi:MAG: MFS transporter, partial [Anaerovorax sp.]
MKMERWKINLYTLWVTQVFAQMGFGLSVPFIPYYLQTMGVSGTTQLNFYVGLASTLPAATMAIFAPIWGKVSDIYGRKVMIVRAMVAACILFILMSFSNTVWMFLVLRAIQGVFTGTITASMAFVSANTPQYKMSFALGFMTSSNFLGYAIGPAVGGFLAEAMGYSACFLVGSGIMAAGFLLVIFLVKEDKNSYGARLA